MEIPGRPNRLAYPQLDERSSSTSQLSPGKTNLVRDPGWGRGGKEGGGRHITTAQLLNELVEAADEPILSRVIGRYGRLDLLCIDDIGLLPVAADAAEGLCW